jgi:DNA-binding SARP family transcriptional activator
VNFAQQVGRFQLRLLGPLELIAPNGDDIAPRGRRARAIIAILAVAEGKPLERAALQDKLWSSRPPLQGRDSLKKALAEIRQAFGSYAGALLVENGSLVALNTSLVDMDLFEDAALHTGIHSRLGAV